MTINEICKSFSDDQIFTYTKEIHYISGVTIKLDKNFIYSSICASVNNENVNQEIFDIPISGNDDIDEVYIDQIGIVHLIKRIEVPKEWWA